MNQQSHAIANYSRERTYVHTLYVCLLYIHMYTRTYIHVCKYIMIESLCCSRAITNYHNGQKDSDY